MQKIRLVNHDLKYSEQIFKLSSFPAVKNALGLPDGTVEDTKLFIKRVLKEEFEGITVSKVIVNEQNDLVGLTELMFIDPEKKICHVGTWIGYEYWGLGYNLASKIAILEIAFEQLELDYVFAGARKVNLRSQKAQEKLPFIRLSVEAEFPKEHKALESKEKQACILNVFYKEDFFRYMEKAKSFSTY
ncbi:GNAT family N-acetyltransferase [Planomicrobium chinense]|uniref:GNAT family N-acetyltransferase n=1 Tax=Planococcus chinensis TaxID=272917 RepID=UPI001CC5299E|nr:GNAT family N-acetyltransferase [Planococcus chinensis]MBZ5202347.1 GNAT family N-acetyltransferase [Planococcus chinensis]